MIAETKKQTEDLGKSQAVTDAIYGVSSAYQVDLFAAPPKLTGAGLEWLDTGNLLSLGLVGCGDVFLESDELDRYTAYCQIKDIKTGRREDRKQILGPIGDKRRAIEQVEAWVKMHHPEAVSVLRKNAPWKNRGPSEKQLALCKKLRIRVAQGATKGDVSRAISRMLNRKRA